MELSPRSTEKMVKVLVVGAGIMGLSTALQLKRKRPYIAVKIVADKFLKETTSHGAAGLFRPNALHTPGVPEPLLRKWSEDSFKFYSSLALSELSAVTGAMVSPGYVFQNEPLINPTYKDMVYSYRELAPEEITKLNVQYKYGYQVTTVVLDQTRYMPWLMKQVQAEGVEFEKRTVNSLEEFVGLYDVVVNCGGIRAGQLVGDDTVFPVRGQMVMVEAPWIKHWVYTEDLAFFVPKQDGHTIALGGTRQKGRYDLEKDPKDRQAILDRCYKLWPSLKNARITGEWVDLRPHRIPIRVEKETRRYNNGSLEVVHNYCHGSNGISLSWGSSTNAVNLVLDALQNKSKL